MAEHVSLYWSYLCGRWRRIVRRVEGFRGVHVDRCKWSFLYPFPYLPSDIVCRSSIAGSRVGFVYNDRLPDRLNPIRGSSSSKTERRRRVSDGRDARHDDHGASWEVRFVRDAQDGDNTTPACFWGGWPAHACAAGLNTGCWHDARSANARSQASSVFRSRIGNTRDQNDSFRFCHQRVPWKRSAVCKESRVGVFRR
jgi:hypothetical protein